MVRLIHASANMAKFTVLRTAIMLGTLLSEDEYICFNSMDEEDEDEYGIELAQIQPPIWHEYADQLFEYLGTY